MSLNSNALVRLMPVRDRFLRAFLGQCDCRPRKNGVTHLPLKLLRLNGRVAQRHNWWRHENLLPVRVLVALAFVTWS